eukprot:m.285367 g.285367  ORF g.285367 m.285367 type:complete len:67 (+) comp17774_c0_seq3:262-462(+)
MPTQIVETRQARQYQYHGTSKRRDGMIEMSQQRNVRPPNQEDVWGDMTDLNRSLSESTQLDPGHHE